ncbi:mitochondrial thiamine pyrophosphate transporter [Dinochytrium kinnereticum]|nr:mitochondrial thiamine pyrophosphate transporter [Dinochytrium kinnereticum]
MPYMGHTNFGKGTQDFIGGGLAGIVSKTVVMPFDVVRKRLQVQGPDRNSYVVAGIPRYKGNFVSCALQIIRHEGYLALYKARLKNADMFPKAQRTTSFLGAPTLPASTPSTALFNHLRVPSTSSTLSSVSSHTQARPDIPIVIDAVDATMEGEDAAPPSMNETVKESFERLGIQYDDGTQLISPRLTSRSSSSSAVSALVSPSALVLDPPPVSLDVEVKVEAPLSVPSMGLVMPYEGSVVRPADEVTPLLGSGGTRAGEEVVEERGWIAGCLRIVFCGCFRGGARKEEGR